MPRLSLWRENHSNDYKFQDRRILELFTAGGTGVNVNKYLGPNDQGASTDHTLPSYTNATEKNIQDLLFLENRDRKYDRNIYNMRTHYTIQDTDFNLSQFGLFVTNDTLFFTFHINDMIERMGRKIMPGDVLELLHLRDYNPLDPNDEIPIALRKYYVVQESTRAAEGFAPTWWPHLWRCKAQPMVDGQEYRDILEQGVEGTGYNPIKDYLSTYSKNVNINDAVIAQAEQDVPASGYNTQPFFVLPVDADGHPLISRSLDSDTTAVTVDSGEFTSDYTYVTPVQDYTGWLTGDGVAPNGYPVKALTYFPDMAIAGDFVLRLDYLPNRLFRFDGRRWNFVEDNIRASLTGSSINTQLGSFVNNNNTTTLKDGTKVPQRQALSTILTAKADV